MTAAGLWGGNLNDRNRLRATPYCGADGFGFRDVAGVHWSLGAPQLYEHALQRHEARIAVHGPLVADTGVHTGRSPKDKFVVRDPNTDPIVWWDGNTPMSVFAQDLYGGADPVFRASSPNTPGIRCSFETC